MHLQRCSRGSPSCGSTSCSLLGRSGSAVAGSTRALRGRGTAAPRAAAARSICRTSPTAGKRPGPIRESSTPRRSGFRAGRLPDVHGDALHRSLVAARTERRAIARGTSRDRRPPALDGGRVAGGDRLGMLRGVGEPALLRSRRLLRSDLDHLARGRAPRRDDGRLAVRDGRDRPPARSIRPRRPIREISPGDRAPQRVSAASVFTNCR